MLTKIGIVVFVVVAGVSLGQVIKKPLSQLMGMSSPAPPVRSTPSLPPVAIPPSGVLENYATSAARHAKETASSTNESLGRLRIYSAPPKEADGSGFQNKCSESENDALLKRQHYFVRVADAKNRIPAITSEFGGQIAWNLLGKIWTNSARF